MEILAFDFGGTQGRCALAARDGKLAHAVKLQRAGHEDGGRWFARLLAAGTALAARTPRITAVAVSFGGPVGADGRILSMHVPGWEQIDLKAELTARFNAPVVVENDANCGAVGEFHFGAGRGLRSIAYFTVSTGIGGGVILDGKLFRGAHGMAAEFGHMILDGGPGAPQYAAGKPGALEALASGPAIAREGRVRLQRDGKKIPDDFSARTVFEAAKANEKWAVDILDVALAHLARGIAAAACAFDVERTIIGGGVSLAGDALFIPLRKKVKQYLPHYLEDKSDVVPAELGDDAPILGAVALAANA